MLTAACVTLPREPFIGAEQSAATPPGFEHVRWTEGDPALADTLRGTLRPGPDGLLNIIAISGGGANGAYGAGLVSEWTKRGGRPVFQLVTGVSVGALSAPFVFLGSGWDAQLSDSFLNGDIQHLLQGRGLAALITPGIYSKKPLKRLVDHYVTDDLLAAVAAEHAKGRRLLVATTNLDTEQLVVWDMGAIATHGGPAARKLFADVLVASSSVPVVFPPSLITVEDGGRRFREMHVDGQTESGFFGVPQTLLLGPTLAPTPYHVRFYVIVNGSIEPAFAVTPRATIPILSRTASAAEIGALRSLLIANAEFCRANGCSLYIASLPQGVRDESLDFSAEHIAALFSAGKSEMDADRAWQSISQATSLGR